MIVRLKVLRLYSSVRAPGGLTSSGSAETAHYSEDMKYEIAYHVDLQLLEITRGKERRWVHASSMKECEPALDEEGRPVLAKPKGKWKGDLAAT